MKIDGIKNNAFQNYKKNIFSNLQISPPVTDKK